MIENTDEKQISRLNARICDLLHEIDRLQKIVIEDGREKDRLEAIIKVEMDNATIEENKLIAEIDRLQAAKREALKIADERSKENVELRSQLVAEQARSELFNARLSNEIDNCVLQEQRAERLREELKEAIADHDYDARRWAEEIKAAQDQLVKARAAFERYADHEADCVEEPWHGKGIHTCSCGFYEAMIALSDEEGKP